MNVTTKAFDRLSRFSLWSAGISSLSLVGVASVQLSLNIAVSEAKKRGGGLPISLFNAYVLPYCLKTALIVTNQPKA